jgi:hypothetical protein
MTTAGDGSRRIHDNGIRRGSYSLDVRLLFDLHKFIITLSYYPMQNIFDIHIPTESWHHSFSLPVGLELGIVDVLRLFSIVQVKHMDLSDAADKTIEGRERG